MFKVPFIALLGLTLSYGLFATTFESYSRILVSSSSCVRNCLEKYGPHQSTARDPSRAYCEEGKLCWGTPSTGGKHCSYYSKAYEETCHLAKEIYRKNSYEPSLMNLREQEIDCLAECRQEEN